MIVKRQYVIVLSKRYKSKCADIVWGKMSILIYLNSHILPNFVCMSSEGFGEAADLQAHLSLGFVVAHKQIDHGIYI